MRLTPRYRLILTIVAVTVVVVVAALILVLPQFGRMAELDQQIQDANNQIDQAQTLLKTRQQARESAAFTDAALLELLAAVPENPDLPSLIIELQDTAYASNAKLQRVEPQEIVPADGFMILPLRLDITADWVDSVDFVQRLQRLSRQVRVLTINTVVAAPEADFENPVTTQIQIETYLIPTSQTPPAGAAPAPAPTQ